jgi:uncharacterized membrane protein
MSEVVMFIFPSRSAMADAIEQLDNVTYAKIKHSAVIAKAEDGETVIFEDDISPNEGGIVGGTLGALMGSLGIAGLGAFLLPGVGPIIAIGAGALVGGLVGGATGNVSARLIDMGINDAQLKMLAQHLGADKIALVAELDDSDSAVLTQLETDLKPFQAEIVRQ